MDGPVMDGGTWTDGERLARAEAMLDECHALLRTMLMTRRPLPAGLGPSIRALLVGHGVMEAGDVDGGETVAA